MAAKSWTIRLIQGIALASIGVVSAACSLPPMGSSAGPQPGAYPERSTGEEDQMPAAEIQVGTGVEMTCTPGQLGPETDFEIFPVPVLPEPTPRIPFVDPVFGNCLVRATDRTADLDPGDPSGGLKNEYARVQSFNADGSRLLAYTTDGNWYLYDALSLLPIGQIPVAHEPRWDALDPDLLYYLEETRLVSYRITSGQRYVVHEFADDFPGQRLAAVWTKYEGSPSMDGRYWGLMAEDPDWMTVAFLVYDIESDRVVALRETAPSEIDSVTISPSGDYFLAYYDNACPPGQLGSQAQPCGLMVFDQNLEHGRGLLRIVGHSDLAVDESGKDVVVYQDIEYDSISMLDLESGSITPLLPIDFSHSALGFHFSGRAFDLPGWALVSTSNGAQPSSTWMDDQIFALELKKDGRVVRLAHTHSVYDENIEHDYWAESHASVNQNFTRVVYTSNWGRSGTDEVDMYVIELPSDWVNNLP